MLLQNSPKLCECGFMLNFTTRKERPHPLKWGVIVGEGEEGVGGGENEGRRECGGKIARYT